MAREFGSYDDFLKAVEELEEVKACKVPVGETVLNPRTVRKSGLGDKVESTYSLKPVTRLPNNPDDNFLGMVRFREGGERVFLGRARRVYKPSSQQK
ncbi:hypothetical protein A2686_04165 [Candidatus Woesebacteria bacterium RIFCSPHIGHO2_01_FULL_38_10]|uniref:Uncharacterized protein n=1 Tax=Candidatus Woesebacteria bacterium RIFCSPLOWO2_01_FULL_39_10b TaxID=1802517 RepID=A0A1F8BAD6_9BACT|nr:MAG: hypothetical protein A2686_04165 [Candidatus Woesebacteria bacterium RIFCSPHIGHO2_01_FULL_38_10]OGM60328.1 MAG: hypothetical protein A2892_03230 [Candidatus Woesebacteria bacterium RIFCSPLOWO2_01_FULL_39_10b]